MKLNSTIQQKYGTIYEWNKENPTLLKEIEALKAELAKK